MDSFENSARRKKVDKDAEVRELIKKSLEQGTQAALTGSPVQPVQPQGLGAFFGLSEAPQEAQVQAPSAHDSGINLLSSGNDPESTARDWIIGKESSGKTTAKNPNSSAFGLGQLIRANREAYGKRLGIDPDTVDYNEQLALMDAYVKERYGSYQKAMEFWQQHNWY